LGFNVFHGDLEQNWLIMKNENTVIGLFQGMFERNIMTFNPGWNENAEPLESFMDIRQIQNELQNKGIPIPSVVDENDTGPASLMISDPDGNPILIDQHV